MKILNNIFSVIIPARCEKLKIFKERIIVNSYFTRNPSNRKFMFHPSDWVSFGLTEDIKKLWNIPLAPEPQTQQWFKDRPKPPNDFKPDWLYRYTNEQYIWSSFLKKYVDLKFESYLDITDENVFLSELSFANNLIVLDYGRRFPIKFEKFNPEIYGIDDIIDYKKWKKLYNRECAREGC